MNKKYLMTLVVVFAVVIVVLLGIIWHYAINGQPQVSPIQSGPVSQANSTTAPVAAAIPPPAALSTQSEGPITAASVDMIPATETFSLAAYPQASFTLGNIYFGTGGVPDASCANAYPGGNSYVSIKNGIVGSSPDKTCIDAATQIDGQNIRVVAFTVTTADNGPLDAYGIFVRGTYDLPDGTGGTVHRQAQENPPWAGYGTSAYSSRDIILGFEIPVGVTRMNLYYGNYPTGNEGTTRANFNDEGGYAVDFSAKTIQEIQD